MRDDLERLRHILEAIQNIERYVGRGKKAFLSDELLQVWMVRHIEIIGEAARATSSVFRENYPEIPWHDVIGMRHVLVHDYFGVDLDIVWQVVEHDLPDLKRKIEHIVRTHDHPDTPRGPS
ncbi:MAG: DUF86 domain-containing protein [Armatimonadetes bacterium]|nr:DUF86 domain-containing protein [Armatimonadota bacterium]